MGSRRWDELGRPPLPALVIDGEVTPLFHVSQISAALGLPGPDGGEWIAAGWDIAAILRAWCDHLQEAGFELALEPTPSRGRTLRNLTVNVFHPLELLADAGETGRFDWDPDLDEERELPAHERVGPECLRQRGHRRLARLPAELRRGARPPGGLHAAR